MKRFAVVAAILASFVVGFQVLGNPRKAAGPPGAGVTSAANPGKDAAPKGPPPVPILVDVVAQRPMKQTLEVTGTLKTDEDVQIGSRIAGRAVRVTVKEGDRVSQGQELVRLDDRELRAQIARARGILAAAEAKVSLARNQRTMKDMTATSDLERAEGALVTAKARVQQAETAAKLVDVETRIRIETAQSGVRVAKERLSIARDLTRKQQLRQAQLAVEQSTAQMEQAWVDMENQRQVFERRQTLYKQDAIAKEEVEEADRRFKALQTQFRMAQAGVGVAQQKLELAAEGSRPEEVRVAEEQLVTAEQNLQQAESDARRKQLAQNAIESARAAEEQAEAAVSAARAGLSQKKMSLDEISNARAAVSQARADIALYETQLADLSIRSPVAGVVATRQVNVGEMVTPTTPLMNLVALDAIYLEAQAPELEVGLLKPGARADVTVDALRGQTLSGSVREIIPVAERTSKAFRVRIAVLGGGGRLPSGAYARARVHVGDRPNAITVAKDAIVTEAGERYVWVVADDGKGGSVAHRQVVALGLIDQTRAEVLSGLKPGQQVVTSGSPAIIEGTPVHVQSPTEQAAPAAPAQKPH